MNLLFRRSKKFIVSILVFALLLGANLGLCVSVANSFKNGVDAVGFENQNSITVSNGTFKNYSDSTQYPYTPSNFTFSETSSNVLHGIININKTTFNSNCEEKYGLEKDDYPAKDNLSDNFCLMLNSRKACDNVGYTSSEFTFSKNGSYYVSVEVFTDDVDSSASLYLYNDGQTIGEINGINTKKTWKTYYFFVTTNDYEDMKLNIGLFLGGKSVSTFALFDEVEAGEISNSVIKNFTIGSSIDGKNVFTEFGKNVFYIDYSNENIIEELDVDSNNFKDAQNSTFDKKLFDTITLDGEVTSILKLENTVDAKAKVETKTFDLISNKVYKMSILVKVEEMTSGNAYIQACTVEDGEEVTSSDKLSITSTTNTLNDNFVEYSIVINSDPTKDVKVKFVCGLINDSGEAIGKVSFAKFKFEVVPYNEFSNVDSSTQKAFDLSKDYSSSGTISNSSFNLSKPSSLLFSEVELSEATNWTVNKSSSSYSQYAGVFNVKDFDRLKKTEFSSVNNPGFITSINTTTNNVLMLHNAKNDVLSVTSDSFSLSSSSYYVLSVYVQTQQEGKATIQLVSDSIVLAEIKDISTNGLWKEYKLYLKTGYDALSTTLKLSLGTDETNSRGFAFFDDCLLTTSEAKYNASSENKFDVSSPLNLKGKNGEALAFSEAKTVSASAESKVINLNDDISFDLPHEYRESAKEFAGENKNVLLLKSEDADNCYYLESKLGYSLSSGSYYKFSVDVYTANMSSEQENVTSGASLSLSGLTDAEFSSVVSNKNWTTYTFYIAPNSSVTTKLSLGIGVEERLCKGMAMFGNISFEKMDSEDEYNLAIANLDDTCKVITDVEEDEDEETEETKKSKKEINWVLLTSTLTAVAVIIAVVGVAFKKVFKPNKKRVKKSKVDYDRNTSVMRQKYRKLAYLKRERDVRKLEKKEEYLFLDREEKEAKYKDLLKKVREVKLGNRDGKFDADLAQLNKELNHASREVAKSGVTINKIKSEIAYMKTEGYLTTLEKKLRKQDELAKQKGSSIEEILASEDNIILGEEDRGLDEALEKANKLIEEKNEAERLEKERKLEEERLKEEKRLEEEKKLEQEKKDAEIKTENLVDETETKADEIETTSQEETAKEIENVTEEPKASVEDNLSGENVEVKSEEATVESKPEGGDVEKTEEVSEEKYSETTDASENSENKE